MSVAFRGEVVELSEWEALSDARFELVGGMLEDSPRPRMRHQMASHNLCRLLNDQLPDELTAIAEAEVLLEERPLTIRVPDLIVVDSVLADTDPARCKGTDVRLAVEVHSQATMGTDRVTKFAEYAAAGIAEYWMVDLRSPVTLTAYTLADSRYQISGKHSGKSVLSLSANEIAIDLDTVGSRRPRSH